MPELSVYTMEGESREPIAVRDEIFGLQPHVSLMHQAVVAEEKARRNPTASTKKRDEVHGTGAKVWRQKGTGRARHGSRKANVFVGGGVVFGPKHRDMSVKLPKKMRRKAVREALSAKLADGELIVLEELTLDDFSTKTIVGVLNALELEGSVLLILGERDEKVERSCRNVVGLDVRVAPTFGTRDILSHDNILLTKNAVEKLEEAWPA